MEQSPFREVDTCSVGQNFLCVTEPKYSLLCSQDPATSLYWSQLNPVHTLLPHFPKIYFNIILLFAPRSPDMKGSWECIE